MLDLLLRYEDNGTAHDDVLLRFAGQTWVSNSYYFALDRELQPGNESPAKVKAVLRRLLEQWLTAVANLPDGGKTFLPYDFSDQSTSWLCCQRHGKEMVVSRGSAPVEGYSFSPSAVGEYLSRLPGFYVDGPIIQSNREDLLQAIRDSLAEAT